MKTQNWFSPSQEQFLQDCGASPMVPPLSPMVPPLRRWFLLSVGPKSHFKEAEHTCRCWLKQGNKSRIWWNPPLLQRDWEPLSEFLRRVATGTPQIAAGQLSASNDSSAEETGGSPDLWRGFNISTAGFGLKPQIISLSE